MSPTDHAGEPTATTDRDAIRDWADERGVVPIVDEDAETGVALRDPDGLGDDRTRAEWETFFDAVEARNLALYHEGVDGGGELLGRSTAAERLGRPLDEVDAALDGGGTATAGAERDEGTVEPDEAVGTERPSGERDSGAGTPAESRRPGQDAEAGDDRAGEGDRGDAAAEQVPAENVDAADGSTGTTSRDTERTEDATVREDPPDQDRPDERDAGVDIEADEEGGDPPSTGQPAPTPDDDGPSATSGSKAAAHESPSTGGDAETETEVGVAGEGDSRSDSDSDSDSHPDESAGDTRTDPDADRTENAAHPDRTMGDDVGPGGGPDDDTTTSDDPDPEGGSPVPSDAGTDDTSRLSDADVGKGVFDDDGTELGMVAGVEDDGPLRVDPDPGLTDRLRGVVGWGRDDDDDRTLARSAVERVEDDRIVVDPEAASVGSGDGADDGDPST